MAIVKQKEADKRPVAKNSFTMACHTSLLAGSSVEGLGD